MGRRKRRSKSWALLRRDEILTEGHDVVEPACPLHASCGGCSWQDVAYSRQLELKAEFIQDCLLAAGLEDIPRPTVIASPDLFHYRNHMEFSFSSRRWLTPDEIASGQEYDRDFALGLHAPGGFNRVLDVPSCPIQSEDADAVLEVTRRFAKESERPAYHQVRHDGFWRYLSIRKGVHTGQLLVQVVTHDRDDSLMSDYAAALTAEVPGVVTVVNGVTDSLAGTSVGARLHVDHGAGEIEEHLDGHRFILSAGAFFQPNTLAAEIIAKEVVALSGATESTRVLDLFCGIGTLSLSLAAKASEVVGLELVATAVECARRNAELNGIEGCRFETMDLAKGLPEDLGEVDVVVTDPPRAGMHRRVVEGLRRLAPRVIVSVGCNPKTQAADLAALCHGEQYRVTAMRAVDQFPHTPHVENLARLDRVAD